MERWKETIVREILTLKMADTDPKRIKSLQRIESKPSYEDWRSSATAMPSDEYMRRFRPHKRPSIHSTGVIRTMGGLVIEVHGASSNRFPNEGAMYVFDLQDAREGDEISNTLKSSDMNEIFDLVWKHKAKYLFNE